MTRVISMAEYRLNVLGCTETPGSTWCTERLYERKCPGWDAGKCVSPKLDPSVHNELLPTFFVAQHD